MTSKPSKFNRRNFLRMAGLAGLGAGLSACAPQVVTQIVKETQIVEQTSVVKETQIVEQTQIVEKQVTPTPVAFKTGGTLTIGINGDTKTLDPHVSQLWVWQNARRCVFEQLVKVDDKGNILPYLASAYKWVDNKTLEFTLRTDVVFHNGEKFTADDVKWTFDRLATKDLPSEYPARMQSLDTVVVVAPDQVRFTLKNPDVTLLNVIADVDILSKSVPVDNIPTTPVGTGAYKFVEWLPNEQIHFGRFDKYHEAGQPYLDNVVYKPIPDSEARIASMAAGQIDVNFEVALKDMARVATQPGVKVKKLSGGTLWMMYLNLTTAPFNDIRIRQALLYGFDRQRYNRDFLTGLARVTNTPLDPTNWAYNADVDKMYLYDKEKALSLLKDAGYDDKKPLSIEIIYPVGLEEYQTVSEFFQSQMTDINVKVKVTGMELAAWSNKVVKERSYQLAFDGRSVETFEPALPYNDYTFTKPDKGNFDGFTDQTIPGYMDLINQGVAETDQAKRKDIYMKLQQMWADALPGWILVGSPNFLVENDYVMDYDYWGSQPFRLYKTWLNK
jgi:peptide/nickel transport system substrate-binding protein